MAKLSDVATKAKKPIIWIDDPISSLDSDHVFFVYSLLKDEIVANQSFEQLFISTHNLDFLKYLKRLDGKNSADGKSFQKLFCIVQRKDKISTIEPMPKYLKEYITEFNYLFHQIYKCANETISDSNYTIFYNFGNNARKFMEIFLAYKYPDAEKTTTYDKIKKFFGDDITYEVINRLNNEYSHLAGAFERGETPIDVPEIKKVAERIMEKIEKADKEQFDALLQSIDEQGQGS
jgi:wobble nucleotide-excising tRNase